MQEKPMQKENANITVLITGATGVAGSGVFAACLKDPRIKKITTITRKPLPFSDKKITPMLHDNFLDYSTIEDKLKGIDVCFWCLGISQSKARKEEDYTRITHDFTLKAAEILKQLNPDLTFCFLSGMGTDSTEKSRMMWARVKGKTENALSRFEFNLFNFRPGFIHPMKGQKSPLVGKILYPFIKNSKKMCVEADELGRAMINAALLGYEKHTLENSDIRELAKRWS
jgi:uncharacterized protein YbjT (DUF2867 family)